MTVQGHASLCAYLLKKPVKVHLSRDESIRMHPKRHPIRMEISLACDAEGKFTGLKLDALGDTGAYASVGTKVMERVVGPTERNHFQTAKGFLNQDGERRIRVIPNGVDMPPIEVNKTPGSKQQRLLSVAGSGH